MSGVATRLPGGASPVAKGAVLALFLATALAAWLAASAVTPPYALPPPLAVLRATADFFLSARKFGHLAASIEHVAAAIAISFLAGSLFAFLAHYAGWTAPALYDRLAPFIGAFPSVGWTLLAVIWFGVSRGTVIFTVCAVLLPFAAATLRIMFGVAWKVVLTAELFGGNRGLGYLINNARQDFDTATIFAAIALIIALVVGADRLLFAPLERHVAGRFA